MKLTHLFLTLVLVACQKTVVSPRYNITVIASESGYIPPVDLVDQGVYQLSLGLYEAGLTSSPLTVVNNLSNQHVVLWMQDDVGPCPFGAYDPDSQKVVGCAYGINVALTKPSTLNTCDQLPAWLHELTHVFMFTTKPEDLTEKGKSGNWTQLDGDINHSQVDWWNVSERIETNQPTCGESNTPLQPLTQTN